MEHPPCIANPSLPPSAAVRRCRSLSDHRSHFRGGFPLLAVHRSGRGTQRCSGWPWRGRLCGGRDLPDRAAPVCATGARAELLPREAISRMGSVVRLVVKAPSTCTKDQSTATPSVALNLEPDFPGSWWPSPRHRCPNRGPREIRPPGAGRPPGGATGSPAPRRRTESRSSAICGSDQVDRAPRWR
jgi:hypothetical protein